jgi:hypothetical protein
MQRLFAGDEIKHLGAVAEVLVIASGKPGFVDRLIDGAYLSEADGMATFEKLAGKLKSVRVL